MTWINRHYEKGFKDLLKKPKVLVIYGPRQVGKSSLVKRMLQNKKQIFQGDGNDLNLREILESMSLTRYSRTGEHKKLIKIDGPPAIASFSNWYGSIIE